MHTKSQHQTALSFGFRQASAMAIPSPFRVGWSSARNDHRNQASLHQWIRQHLGLALEDVPVPVLVAGHAQSQLFVTPTTELEKLANGDLLELNGWGHNAFGDSGLGGWSKFNQPASVVMGTR